jgi:hypothetical protein
MHARASAGCQLIAPGVRQRPVAFNRRPVTRGIWRALSMLPRSGCPQSLTGEAITREGDVGVCEKEAKTIGDTKSGKTRALVLALS